MSVGADQIQNQPQANSAKIEVTQSGGSESKTIGAVKGQTYQQVLEAAGLGNEQGTIRFNNRPVNRDDVVEGDGFLLLSGNAEGGD